MGACSAASRPGSSSSPTATSLVITAQAPHGQSHETTLAQVAADEMGVPFDHVRVVHGDTRVTPVQPHRHRREPGGDLGQRRRADVDPQGQGEGARHRGGDARDQPRGPRDHRRRDHAEGACRTRRSPSPRSPCRRTMAPNTLPAGTDARLEAHERVHGRGHHRQRVVGRHPRLHGRGRPRNRPGPDPALRRGRGLRPGHQPGHRRGADPGRRRAGHRRGALRARRLRRGRQLPRRHVHGLPAAHRGRDPHHRDRAPRDRPGGGARLPGRGRGRRGRRPRHAHQRHRGRPGAVRGPGDASSTSRRPRSSSWPVCSESEHRS